MRIKSLSAALVVIVSVSAAHAFADQKIKTKSNIKNDRVAQATTSAECAGTCAEGERCVKSPAGDTVATDKAEVSCVAVSETASSTGNKDAQ